MLCDVTCNVTGHDVSLMLCSRFHIAALKEEHKKQTLAVGLKHKHDAQTAMTIALKRQEERLADDFAKVNIYKHQVNHPSRTTNHVHRFWSTTVVA